jgi:hypothetical protein
MASDKARFKSDLRAVGAEGHAVFELGHSNGDSIANGWLQLVGVVLFAFALILLMFYLAHLSVSHERRQKEAMPTPQQTVYLEEPSRTF